MTVRSQLPLGVRLVVGLVAAAVAIAIGVALSRTDVARAALGHPDARVDRLLDENRALRDERDRLLESGNTADSRRAMEGATIRELGEQIARLEADNARLKEDVAFFEAATADRSPATTKDAGIAIRRLQVIQDRAAHTARYRILLTQDSKANRDFAGTLQFALTVQQGARTVGIVVPDDAGRAPGDVAYAVDFRSYKRIDGSFAWPADAVLRSVQARILERGAVRAQQTVAVD